MISNYQKEIDNKTKFICLFTTSFMTEKTNKNDFIQILNQDGRSLDIYNLTQNRRYFCGHIVFKMLFRKATHTDLLKQL